VRVSSRRLAGRRPPRSSDDAPGAGDTNIILRGAEAAFKIVIWTVMMPDSFREAGAATAGWGRQVFRRRGGDQEEAAWHLVGVTRAWWHFIVALAVWPFVTFRNLPAAVRGARRLSARLSFHSRARRRAAASAPAGDGAVFISYRTSEHGEQARGIARMLSAQGFEVWLDEDRGTLPTHILLLDRVLEDSVRRARVLLCLLPSTGTSTAEPDPYETGDRAMATLVHTAIWAVLVYSIFDGALKWSRAEDRGLRPDFMALTLQRTVPPSLRKGWHRVLYDLDVEFDKQPGESWYAWEGRIAGLYGVPVVTVLTGPTGSGSAAAADVRLADPEADVAGCRRLIDLISAAQPDSGAAVPAARARFWQAAREHPYRTIWRVTRFQPPPPSPEDGTGGRLTAGSG